ncbi:MAG TPA: contractile injection system tape measure protein [Burkholderiaceae bacterium]
MSRSHVIEEATFDVSFDTADTARRQEALLPAFIRDRLLPLADGIFCDFSGEDTILKLDRLELDLGDIPYQGFEDEIERRFKSTLASALNDRKHALAALPPQDRKNDAASPVLTQLKDFLETGLWQAQAGQPDTAAFDRILDACIRSDGPALIRLLEQTPYRATVAKRLARQFPLSHLAAIVDLISAGAGRRLDGLVTEYVTQYVTQYATDYANESQNRPLGGQSEEEFKAALWEQMLTRYLETGAATPDPEQLLSQVTERMTPPWQPRRNMGETGTETQAVSEPFAPVTRAVPEPQMPVPALVVANAQALAETASRQSAATADTKAALVAVPAKREAITDDTVPEDKYFQAIVHRLQGQPGPDIAGLVDEAMRIVPASLARLFRQWQAGAIPGRLDVLDSAEARQLVHAFIKLRHGAPDGPDGPDGPFMGAIETQAAQAKSVTQYYRYVLGQLLHEQNVDLDAAAAIAQGQAIDLPGRPGSKHAGEGDGIAAFPASPPLIHLPSVLEQALKEGHAGRLAGIWQQYRVQHAELIRATLARHMAGEGGIARAAAGFPEFILLDLAALAGRLAPRETAFLEALSRHPVMRREPNRERNSRYWIYTLGHLHAQAGRHFDQTGYLRGLAQRFSEDGAEVEALLRTLREADNADDMSVLHDRLLAEALAAPPPGADSATGQSYDAASTEARLPATSLFAPATPALPPEAAEAYERVLRRLQSERGADSSEAIATLMRTAPARLAYLLQQWQAGKIAGNIESLEIPEARQLLQALVKLRLVEHDETLLDAIEARGRGAPDAARLYRVLLKRLLRKQGSSAGVPGNAMAADALAPQAPTPAHEAAQLIAQRLLGRSAGSGSIACVIEAMLRDSPTALKRLLAQWQSNGASVQIAHLDGAEARQLLRALDQLRDDESGAGLLHAMEAEALQAGAPAAYYRDLLQSLLHTHKPDKLDGPGIAPAWIGNARPANSDSTASGSPRQPQENAIPASIASGTADQPYRQLVSRLQGHRGVSLAEVIEAMASTAPASLEHLFRQMQSGEIQDDMAVLDAAEIRQLLRAFMRLRLAASDALLDAVEMRAPGNSEPAIYYRDMLRRLLRNARGGKPDTPGARAGQSGHAQRSNGAATSPSLPQAPQKSPAPANVASGSADEPYRQLVFRLQGHRGASLADVIESMASTTPASLEQLFRQLQSGAIQDDMAALDAAEIRQLLSAFMRLRLGASDALWRTVEMQAARKSELAAYYRDLLQRLLRNEKPGASGAAPGQSGNAQPANGAGTASGLPPSPQDGPLPAGAETSEPIDEPYRQLVSRLQGHRGMSVADAIETMVSTTPARLERLFRQLQAGEIRADMEVLDAAELRQLLLGFLRLQPGANDMLLRAIDMRAAQVQDNAQHYRSLLRRLLQNQKAVLEAGTASAQTQQDSAPGAARDRRSAGSANLRIVVRDDTSDIVSSDAEPERRLEAGATHRQFPTVQTTPATPEAKPEAPFQASAPSAAAGGGAPATALPAGRDNRMATFVRQIVQRLRDSSGPSIAQSVEAMMQAGPEAAGHLENLLRQLQSGEIGGRIEHLTAHLSGEEAHRLLRAFILPRPQDGSSAFLDAIESQAGQARDVEHYYRHLLKSLLQNENLDLEAAAAAMGPADQIGSDSGEPARPLDSLTADASAQQDIDASPAGRLYRQLVQRLHGRPGPDLTQSMAEMTWSVPENAAILEHLFRQLRLQAHLQAQDGQVRGNVDRLSPNEAQQLLYAFVQSRTNGERTGSASEALLRSIEAGAAQAVDVDRYYRYLLKQAILHGLSASPAYGAPDASAAEHAAPRDADRSLMQPRQADGAAAPSLQQGTRHPDTEYNPMTSNDMPAQRGQTGDAPDAMGQASRQTEILISNAGLAIAAIYLPQLFRMLDLADGTKFKDAQAAERAAHLVQFAANGRCDTPEFQMAFNKLLCGIALDTPIVREIKPAPRETEAIEGMLEAIIRNWRVIGNTSIAGLRESFLQRNGILRRREDGWRLKVERKTIDVLVDRLPWGMSVIKSPWMAQPIHVEWT